MVSFYNVFYKPVDSFLSFSHTNTLRGIAILLVIMQHVGGELGTRLLTPCGGIGVAVFLCISGYGLNESYKRNGLRYYWRKKLLRVFVPYFLFELFYWLFMSDKFNWCTFLLDISLVKAYYWYVRFLFLQYILFYIVTKCLLHYRMFLLILSSLLILLFSPAIEAEQAFSFVSGVFISTKISKVRTLCIRHLLTFSGITLVLGLCFLVIKQLPIIREYDGTLLYYIVQMFIKLPLSFTVIVFSFFIGVHNSFLLFIGGISYELYLVHMKLLVFLDKSHIAITIIALLLISIVISYFFYRINKLYYNKLLSGKKQ